MAFLCRGTGTDVIMGKIPVTAIPAWFRVITFYALSAKWLVDWFAIFMYWVSTHLEWRFNVGAREQTYLKEKFQLRPFLLGFA